MPMPCIHYMWTYIYMWTYLYMSVFFVKIEFDIPVIAFSNELNVDYVTTKKFLIISITKYIKYCPMKFSLY